MARPKDKILEELEAQLNEAIAQQAVGVGDHIQIRRCKNNIKNYQNWKLETKGLKKRLKLNHLTLKWKVAKWRKQKKKNRKKKKPYRKP